MKTLFFIRTFACLFISTFSFAQVDLADKSLTISGRIVTSQYIFNPLKNASLILLAEDGKILASSTTDNNGFFNFDHLDPYKKYMIKVDEKSPGVSNKIKYALIDKKEGIIRETVIDGIDGKLVFRNLPVNPYALPEVSPEEMKFAGNLLYGENSSKPLANTKVNLLNDNGEIKQTAFTNAMGAFVFTNFPFGQNSVVQVHDNDSPLPKNTKVILTNKGGKEIQAALTAIKGGFKFSFPSSDKNKLNLMAIGNSELLVDFKGKFLGDDKSPIANSIVNLINEKGQIVRITRTDKFGDFRFLNLPSDQDVLLSLDENDTQLKTFKKIFLTDSKGNIVKEIKRSEHGFKFSILPSEKDKLEMIDVDDPWLKVIQLKSKPVKENNTVAENKNVHKDLNKENTITIIENIYYNIGESKVSAEGSKTFDRLIAIMKNDSQLIVEIASHTDSRASEEYNMKLSLQRATAAVDYIIKNGIASDRISGRGYGESKLINKCADGIECSEEEHAKNRRTEFKISREE